MPLDTKLYPTNWEQLAFDLKVAAGWRCQWCGARHGDLRRSEDGREWRVVITCAHLDHDPENPHARLAVLCASCHLRYDRSPQQRGRRERNMAMARGQLPLIEELYEGIAERPKTEKQE